jgi:hypothetical protein
MGNLFPIGFSLSSISTGARIAQNQSAQTLRIFTQESKGGIASHGETTQHGLLHPKRIHQSSYVVCELLHCRDMVVQITLAKASPIEGYQAKALLIQQSRRQASPHAAVEWKRVEKDNGQSYAMVVITQFNPINVRSQLSVCSFVASVAL